MSNQKKEPPVFFCDNCGAMVKGDAKQCPECGRIFTSVRCPNCGYSGNAALFMNGCPVCGYSADKDAVRSKPVKKAAESKPSGPPLWVYVVSGAIFVAAAVLLLYNLWH